MRVVWRWTFTIIVVIVTIRRAGHSQPARHLAGCGRRPGARCQGNRVGGQHQRVGPIQRRLRQTLHLAAPSSQGRLPSGGTAPGCQGWAWGYSRVGRSTWWRRIGPLAACSFIQLYFKMNFNNWIEECFFHVLSNFRTINDSLLMSFIVTTFKANFYWLTKNSCYRPSWKLILL